MDTSEPLSVFPPETEIDVEHESKSVFRNQRLEEFATAHQPAETTIQNHRELNLGQAPDAALPSGTDRRKHTRGRRRQESDSELVRMEVVLEAMEQLASKTIDQLVQVPKAKDAFGAEGAALANDARTLTSNRRPLEQQSAASKASGSCRLETLEKVVSKPVTLEQNPQRIEQSHQAHWMRAVMYPAAMIGGLAVIAVWSFLFLFPIGNTTLIVAPPPPVFSVWPPAKPVVTQNPPVAGPRQGRIVEPSLRNANVPLLPFGTREFNGAFAVESEPSGATVLVNQRLVGVTPLRLRLPATSYAVWIERAGYRRWTAGITVPADQLTRVSVKLQADPQ